MLEISKNALVYYYGRDGFRFQNSWCYEQSIHQIQTKSELYMAPGYKMTKILGTIAPLAPS